MQRNGVTQFQNKVLVRISACYSGVGSVNGHLENRLKLCIATVHLTCRGAVAVDDRQRDLDAKFGQVFGSKQQGTAKKQRHGA